MKPNQGPNNAERQAGKLWIPTF